MSTTNEYLKRYNDRMASPNPTATGSTDDVYKLAKQQEYDLLFDKEVALENAKANAMKYKQNSINAQGLGGTGYGSSLQSGIYNTYLNRANEAKKTYADNISNINMQQQQANVDQANDRFQSVTTMIQGADSVDNMNQLLADYGYGSINTKTGKFTWNKTKPEDMPEDDWRQMQYYYRMVANELGGSSNAGLFDYNNDFVYYDKDGEKRYYAGGKGGWNNEIASASAFIRSGDVKEGDNILLENNYNSKIYLKYQNGTLKYITPTQFEKEGGHRFAGITGKYSKIEPKK